MSRDGWIKICRGLPEHYLVGFGQPVPPADPSRGAFSRTEAWLDLLIRCKWKPGKVMNRGRLSNLDIGESVGGTNWLAERWNWTRKTVRGFLDLLEQEAMIERVLGAAKGEIDTELNGNQKGHRGGHQANVIRVCNYSVYQVGADASGPPLGPVEGHHRATTGPQYKKERREEGKKRVLGGESEDGGVGEEVLALRSPDGEAPVPQPEPAIEKPKDARGTRLPEDWALPQAWRDETLQEFDATETAIAEQAKAFFNFWTAKAGSGAVKLNWKRTWENWAARSFRPRSSAPLLAGGSTVDQPSWWWKDPEKVAAITPERWREGIAKHANGIWPADRLGPAPGHKACVVPQAIIEELKLTERYTPNGRARKPQPH
jgi:hypothetical protein